MFILPRKVFGKDAVQIAFRAVSLNYIDSSKDFIKNLF